MAALSELKAEEDAHLDTALVERKDALAHLDTLCKRQDNIYAELHALEDNDEEPLGCELRELGAEHAALGDDIRLLEEKLVAMRNRRRWLKEKMEDVKNRREAGLSGYRAAGRDVDLEVRSLMHRPPITPLDIEAISKDAKGKDPDTLKGTEFVRLRPERRTAEMARAWWEGEVALLQRRKTRIQEDRDALAAGTTLWSEVTDLVAEFESKLRELIKGSQDSQDEAESEHAAVSGHLAKMETVVSGLEQRLQLAEENHWNLLICAIGAELEAFLEAKALLKATFGVAQTQPVTERSEPDDHNEPSRKSNERHDESDNEVPADLLVSRLEEPDHEPPNSPQQRSVVLRREYTQSPDNNDPPPEFLVQHKEAK